MISSLVTAFRLSRGYRLNPWKSPYLRWRIETWSGMDADSLTPRTFLRFIRDHRVELMRYLRWAGAKGRI